VPSDEPNKLSRAKQHWVDIAQAAHAVMTPVTNAAKTAATTAMLEQFESDIAPLVAPLAQKLLDNPDTPDELRDLLGVLTGPTHFGESVVIGIAIGALLSPVLGAALAPVVQTVANTAWSGAISADPGTGGVPLSPEVLAAAVLKGGTTSGGLFSLSVDPYAEAAKSGIDTPRMDDLIHIAGQSFGLELALLLQRRGQLVGITLQDVLEYSNMNPKFYASAANAIYLPPTGPEVLSATRRGWLPDATARVYFGHAGIDPDLNYDWMLNATGHPVSFGQAVNLYHRKIFTLADLQLAAQREGLHPDYNDTIEPLTHHYPAVFQVLELVRTGAMTAERAATVLGYEGFEQVDIDSIVSTFNTSTSGKVKELSATQVTRAYEQKLITPAEATTRLTALNYDAPTVTLILAVADNAREDALLQATIKKVGNLYVGHKLTKADATTELGNAGVAADAITTLFKFWDIERGATAHSPSPAATVGAYRRGVITAADCKNRLQLLGISDADIPIIVADGYPPTKTAEVQTAVNDVMNA